MGLAVSPASAETATLAEYLRVDLQRIASSVNEDLRAIGRGAVTYPVRRAAEVRVINEARALATRRVESTMRQLSQMGQRSPIQPPRPDAVRGRMSTAHTSDDAARAAIDGLTPALGL
jgi:hypothetical protein